MRGWARHVTAARTGAAAVLWVAASAAPLAAQEEPAPTAGKIAMLVFFLDSTETQPAHTATIGLSYSARRTPGGDEWEEPALYGTYGLTPRLDVSLSLSRARGEYSDGYSDSGIGDAFLSFKLRVRDSRGQRIGVAFEPTLEILGEASLSAGEQGPGKYNVALPIIVQRGVGAANVFAEAGYITRGALFAGLGVDGALLPHLGAGANLLYSRATSDNAFIDADYGLRRSRMDAVAGLYWSIDSRWTLLLSAGRTITTLDANATRRIVSIGLTYRLDLKRHHGRGRRAR